MKKIVIFTPEKIGQGAPKQDLEVQEGQHPLTGQRAPPISGGT